MRAYYLEEWFYGDERDEKVNAKYSEIMKPNAIAKTTKPAPPFSWQWKRRKIITTKTHISIVNNSMQMLIQNKRVRVDRYGVQKTLFVKIEREK